MKADSERPSKRPEPHETFLRLWTVHEPSVRAFVRSCCPKTQEVDDVMQEVGIAALRKFSTLDDHTAFGAWACLIARYETAFSAAAIRTGSPRARGGYRHALGRRRRERITAAAATAQSTR